MYKILYSNEDETFGLCQKDIINSNGISCFWHSKKENCNSCYVVTDFSLRDMFFYLFFSFYFTENSIKFTEILLQQIHKRLLTDEETLANNSNTNLTNWVPKEASELKYIPGYGTFSEALVCCVEEKVRPVLGQLISEMDFNNNLMLIIDNQDYYMEIWLSLFKYFCSKPENLSRFTHPIAVCHFPFSQQMIELLDSIIYDITKQTGSIGMKNLFYTL